MPEIINLTSSSAVNEIVSNKPSFIVRQGISLFAAALCVVGIICWFVQYPDIVKGKAVLAAINPPKAVISNNNGKLVKLFAKEGDSVQQGTVIGYQEAIGNHTDVLTLENKISLLQNEFSEADIVILEKNLNTSNFNLGELQSNFQTFKQAILTYKNYFSNGFYLKKRGMLFNDAEFLKKTHQNLLTQKDFSNQDLELSQKTFAANETLKNEKVISELDYRNEQSKLIGKKISIPQISGSIISNEAQQNDKQKEIAELENTIYQQKVIFGEALHTFSSQIAEWQKKYILKSPVSGKVTFANFMEENMQVKNDQVICYINPTNSNYYAQVDISQYNFGKIKLGQKVLLKLPSYPFEEYGAVMGKIDFISHIASDSGYKAKIILENGLQTNFKKQVKYNEGLQAQAEIITNDMRLLQRFYYNIIKNVK